MSFSGIFTVESEKNLILKIICWNCQDMQRYWITSPSSPTHYYCCKCDSNLLFTQHQKILYKLNSIHKDLKILLDKCILYLSSYGYIHVENTSQSIKNISEILKSTIPCYIEPSKGSAFYECDNVTKNRIFYISNQKIFDDSRKKYPKLSIEEIFDKDPEKFESRITYLMSTFINNQYRREGIKPNEIKPLNGHIKDLYISTRKLKLL